MKYFKIISEALERKREEGIKGLVLIALTQVRVYATKVALVFHKNCLVKLQN